MILTTLLLCSAALSPGLAQIRGTMSNFDAVNSTGGRVTNLELDLRLVQPSDVVDFYKGENAWGLPPNFRDIGGSEVVWADLRNPLLPLSQRHFGLRLSAEAPNPCGVQAYWTRHLKIVEIPVPWQTWRTGPQTVIDVIRLNPEFAEPVILRRQFAIMPVRIDLDDLNWDNPSIPWQPVAADPVILGPGDTVDLPIPVIPMTQAVYVRYTVALARNPDNILTRFVNEAEIDFMLPPIPIIVGSLSNFDATNDTGKPVQDLELDLQNVTPQDIWDWYQGPNSWGLHPVTGDPFIQGGTGTLSTEVTWVDEWKPLRHGDRRHFGLRLNPNTPEPLVRAFWTRVVKTHQLAFPWQWWQTAPGGIVRDVVQLSDTFPESVTILREWSVVGAPIPLNDLVWDNPTIFWNPDPAGPVILGPGEQTSLDIFPGLGAGAVLVRYTVTREDGTQEVRFVNEAELGPSPTPEPVISGTLSNFDVVNLTNVPVTNLELDFRLILPDHILDWYRGHLAWGLHPVLLAPALFALPQTEVAWTAFRDPLEAGETRHFGLELVPDAPAPCGVNAYWTNHQKIFEIPVPWQTWTVPPIDPPQVVDVIRLSPDYPQRVILTREFATLSFRVPLEELMWDNPMITWTPVVSDPVFLNPGDSVKLPIFVTATNRAVLVRYTVANAAAPEDVITRFINEAEIYVGPADQPVSIIGSLSNFDAINTSGKPVHDLELDIRNVFPPDILDIYRGPEAWGLEPVINPLPLGTEVTWVDDANPMRFGTRRHFGLRLNPSNLEPLVRAFWTREVKIQQIPVPWQFWVLPAGPFVRDVVQLSDLYPSGVAIQREFALVDTPVPLNLLNWDLSAAWQPDPTGTILLKPGYQADLDIPITSDDAAVLVRYQVAVPSDPLQQVRFVNQAIMGPGVVSGLRIKPDRTTMVWNTSLVTGTVYDLVMGNLSDLRITGGIHLAQCPPDGNDLPTPFYLAPGIPPPGDGYYYVVRAQFGLVHSTYDTTTDPLRREYRDLEIGPGDCP